jgi:hypothetical protein
MKGQAASMTLDPDFLLAPKAIDLILRAGEYVASKKAPPGASSKDVPALNQQAVKPSAEVSS